MIERTIFSEQHEQYRSTVRRFLEKEVAPHHEQWEEDGYVNRDVWLKAGENGLLCPSMPEEFGGAAADKLYSVVMFEEIARQGFTGLGFGLHNEIVAPYILSYGSAAQTDRYLPAMARRAHIGGR